MAEKFICDFCGEEIVSNERYPEYLNDGRDYRDSCRVCHNKVDAIRGRYKALFNELSENMTKEILTMNLIEFHFKPERKWWEFWKTN